MGDDRANAVTVALSPAGQLSVTYASPVAGTTAHAIFDVTGYFTPDLTGASVTGNLTVTTQNYLGYLTIGPLAQDNPTSSTLKDCRCRLRRHGVLRHLDH